MAAESTTCRQYWKTLLQVHPDLLQEESCLGEWRYGSNQAVLKNLLWKRKNWTNWTQKTTKIVYYYYFKHPMIFFSQPYFKAQLCLGLKIANWQ